MADDVGLEVKLPRSDSAPAVARAALRRRFGGHVDPERLGAAELLVSELASNAFQHGVGEITLRARLDDDRLFVEVIDAGTGFERELRRDEFARIGGWGLDIVDDVASRWGVHEGTTHVWFELEQPGPRLGEPSDTP